MLWFLGYFILKFEIRQIDGSRKPSVKVIYIALFFVNNNIIYVIY